MPVGSMASLHGYVKYAAQPNSSNENVSTIVRKAEVQRLRHYTVVQDDCDNLTMCAS
jgi:hypothetical protein